MGKISIHNVDFEELDELGFEEKFKKRAKNGKFKEDNNETNIQQPQRVSARRGESVSYTNYR